MEIAIGMKPQREGRVAVPLSVGTFLLDQQKPDGPSRQQ